MRVDRERTLAVVHALPRLRSSLRDFYSVLPVASIERTYCSNSSRSPSPKSIPGMSLMTTYFGKSSMYFMAGLAAGITVVFALPIVKPHCRSGSANSSTERFPMMPYKHRTAKTGSQPLRLTPTFLRSRSRVFRFMRCVLPCRIECGDSI